jgi:hypothetical protein
MKMTPAQKDQLVEQFRTILNTDEDVRVSMYRPTALTTKPENTHDSYEAGKTLIVVVARGPVSPLETQTIELLSDGANNFASKS